ncbi:hypothetical protein M758_1G011200 [Ceratodon purpureus]|nr:hypothetical protein M758_1G011200 [Ceratodon purpureus]
MKKYARLRSTSSLPEQCESWDGGKLEVASTTLSLDDDVAEPSAPGKWNSLKLSPPAHGLKPDHGDDVFSSSSHSVLTDALKKLSSLRETHHDIADPLPRGVSSMSQSWGARIVRDTDGGEPHSTFFSAGNNWQRPRSAMGSELQSSSFRSNSNGGAVGSISQGVIRTESSCTHRRHYTHKRSSSMHDVTTLGGQPPAALPTTSMAMAIGGLNPRQPSKVGFAPCFQDDSKQWSLPQLRVSSTSTSAAVAPSARRQPTVTANSPLQSKSCSLWEVRDDPKRVAGTSAGSRVGAVQSMRYDRLQGSGAAGLMGMELGKEERELQSQSVREGAAHAQAIAAMAKAYSEKYGVAQAVVECVSCGRGLGVIVEGNSPGSYNSSFCRSCRPPLLPVASASASSSSWKKGASGVSRGMMHYCRKLLLRMGKKPSHKYTMV